LTFDRCFVQSLNSRGQKEGIRKLASIHFYTFISRKIKREKHGNHSLQRQISYSARFEYLELQKSIWCKLNFFFYSWLEDLSAYQILEEKDLICERYEFSKITLEFSQKTSFVKKQVQSTSQSIQTDIQSLFRQFSSSKLKVKAWKFYAMLFLLF
jgi:hypothetical protein